MRLVMFNHFVNKFTWILSTEEGFIQKRNKLKVIIASIPRNFAPGRVEE